MRLITTGADVGDEVIPPEAQDLIREAIIGGLYVSGMTAT